MAFYYQQDEILDWMQYGVDDFNGLNKLDEKCIYVSEEEIYLTHASPEEHISNDWSVYKNTGLEDTVYPDYTGLMGEDCNGAIDYNQLLTKYEAAILSGAVQDLCESVNLVDEAVLADRITQPNSPQLSFSSIIDYSISTLDGELVNNEQEAKKAGFDDFPTDKHAFLNNEWYSNELEREKLKEIHRATCCAFIAKDDSNSLFGDVQYDVLYSDGAPLMFEGSQEGKKGASSWSLCGNDGGLAAFKDVLNETTSENLYNDSYRKGFEETAVPGSGSKANRAWSHIEAGRDVVQNSAVHQINTRPLSIWGAFHGGSHFQTRQRPPMFGYGDFFNAGSRSQGAIFQEESKSTNHHINRNPNKPNVKEDGYKQSDL